MKKDNYIRRIQKDFIYNNYINTFIEVDNNTIIFNHEEIIYSSRVNKYVNHELRDKFMFKNVIRNSNNTYVNQIFDMDKLYFIKKNNLLYFMYFYRIHNGGVLIHYLLPEIKEDIRILNEAKLKNFLSKLSFVKEKELQKIELPNSDILNLNRNKAKKNTLINNMFTNNYKYYGFDINDGSYLFMNKELCVQNNKDNCYLVSISYTEDGSYKVEYKTIFGVKLTSGTSSGSSSNTSVFPFIPCNSKSNCLTVILSLILLCNHSL